MAKTPRKRLIDKLDKVCMEIVRVRDEWTCQHCGKHVEKSNAHCSHVIPRSRGNYLRWDLLNLKLLCFHCHINWWHKDPTEAGEWFKKRFPDRYEYLEKNRHKVIQYKVYDLEEKYATLRQTLQESQASSS